MTRWLPLVGIILLALAMSGVASAETGGGVDVTLTSEVEKLDSEVPPHILGQLVFQTLRSYVPPSESSKLVVIAADGIDWSWVPSIPNIEFRMVPWGERDSFACQGVKDYIFFQALQPTRHGYRLGIATTNGCFGDGQIFSYHWRAGSLVPAPGWTLVGFSTTHCTPGCKDLTMQPN